jgi:carboxypeptidase PM20D1
MPRCVRRRALHRPQAGQAENVLPGSREYGARQLRLLPGDSSARRRRPRRSRHRNPAIKVERCRRTEASRVAASDAPGYRAIARRLVPSSAPGVVVRARAHDRRHRLARTSTLSPPRLQVLAGAREPEDLKRFSRHHERISTANYVEMIQFYHQLIGNAPADTSQDRSLP